MGNLFKGNNPEVDLKKIDITAKRGNPKEKGSDKEAKSRDPKDKSDKEQISIEEFDPKTAKKSELRTRSPNIKLKDEVEVSANAKPFQNLKSPNSDIIVSQLREQFLADEMNSRLNPRPAEGFPKMNVPAPERVNNPLRQSDQNHNQNIAQQQNYLQMWKEKIATLLKPSAPAQNFEPVQKRGEQNRQENLIIPQKGLLAFIDKAGSNPAIQAWHQQNTEKQIAKDQAREVKPMALPVTEKPVKAPALAPITERIANTFRSSWEIVKEKINQIARPQEIAAPKVVVEKSEVSPAKVSSKPAAAIEVITPRGQLKDQFKDKPQPELPQKIRINNMIADLQKGLLDSIKARTERSTPEHESKIKSIIKEAVEVKRFVEHIQKQDPNPSQAAKEQLQRTVQEAVRIAGVQYPKQASAEQLKVLVTDAVTKLGAFYGIPPAEQYKNEQAKSSERNAEKSQISEPPKRPPVQPPPAFPPAAPDSGFYPNNPSNPVDGRAPGLFKDPFAKKEPDIEKKEKPVKEGEEPDFDEPDEGAGLFPEYKKKIKDDRFLTIQKTYTLSGKVMEKHGQKGIEGVFINGGTLGTAVTNFAGEFKFYNVPEGKIYTLTFLKRGYKFSPSSITDTLDGPHRHYIYGCTE